MFWGRRCVKGTFLDECMCSKVDVVNGHDWGKRKGGRGGGGMLVCSVLCCGQVGHSISSLSIVRWNTIFYVKHICRMRNRGGGGGVRGRCVMKGGKEGCCSCDCLCKLKRYVLTWYAVGGISKHTHSCAHARKRTDIQTRTWQR